jgi:hypothetical protein
MLYLEVRAMDLGEDVRAVGLDLRGADEEPARGPETAALWARVIPALAGGEPWTLDFFSHLNRVREYCARHGIAANERAGSALVISAPEREPMAELFARFEGETFGARAGGPLRAGDASHPGGDAALERDLVRRGLDAYHPVFGNYLFCAVCEFADGSLVVLSQTLGATEILRRIKPALAGQEVEVFQAS